MRNLVAIALLLAACGGSGSVSITEYPDAVRDALCRYYARCGAVESVETCRRINIGLRFGASASEEAAVAMGKSRFDEDAAGACIDAFANRSCDVTSESSRAAPDSCLSIAAGTQHGGAACALDSECISLDCQVPACPDACCMGTCTGDVAPGRAKLGESCELATCDAHSFCDDATVTCVALKPAGSFCAVSQECDYGLDCDPTGTCKPLPGPGEPCTGACRDEGTTCSQASGTCVKVGLAGAACDTSQDCSPVYRCDTSKHCSAGLALGAACTLGQRCADDRAFCDIADGQTTGMCALPKPDGAACQRDAACDSQYCDPLAQTCAAEPVCI